MVRSSLFSCSDVLFPNWGLDEPPELLQLRDISYWSLASQRAGLEKRRELHGRVDAFDIKGSKGVWCETLNQRPSIEDA